ncbi:hypothetical protein PR048_015535 [Dryococelus australis]|uniref:MADF domain-containing protein n=1 Tax=Dryococelus australis TaxID=614101 RepID=A0ABQ9HH69_9NEOP|nr:hypothetical protein PR048_015535 [Dryococelus australis]
MKGKRIGEVLNCKERWKNLRTVFVQKRKLLPSGSSRKVPYYLNNIMQIVVPCIKVQSIEDAASNLPLPDAQDIEAIFVVPVVMKRMENIQTSMITQTKGK